ncbi:MarR family winged helix-turn-helix transcriptional regulator [Paenibacillus humicola]|uniref:MarR family winged helix-turn-helix transcriptional regulator n=1 Tax=Paenibacillus humicola TaxID=3110540 RepID=UPI00237A1997|nr:MarR family transcriptional regulator [Paenibacillus humicola]
MIEVDNILHGWIGFWLKKNYRNICNYLDQQLERHGITNSQLGVLIMLWEKEGLTQKEMVRVLGIQPASMTFLLRGLENKGLIIRKQDAADSRINRIFLTEKGFELKDPCLDIVEKGERVLRTGFSQEEVAMMRMWMKKLDANFSPVAVIRNEDQAEGK